MVRSIVYLQNALWVRLCDSPDTKNNDDALNVARITEAREGEKVNRSPTRVKNSHYWAKHTRAPGPKRAVIPSESRRLGGWIFRKATALQPKKRFHESPVA